MNISLTPQLAGFVRGAIESGMYNNASEVMREALRLMKEKKELRSRRTSPAENRLETARRIKASLASVRRGEYTDYDDAGLNDLVKRVVDGVRKEMKRG